MSHKRARLDSATSSEGIEFTTLHTNCTFRQIPYSVFPHKNARLGVGFYEKSELKKFAACYAKSHESTRWFHKPTLTSMGIEEDCLELSRYLGLSRIAIATELTYKTLTCEFLATLHVESNRWVQFHIMGNIFRTTLATFGECLGLPYRPHGLTQTSRLSPHLAARNELWARIACNSNKFKASTAKSNEVRNPVLRYFLRIFTNSLLGSLDIHTRVTATAPQSLLEALYRKPPSLDPTCMVLEYFNAQADSAIPNISCGGLVTIIATSLGFVDFPFAPVGHNIWLDIEFLPSWFFVYPHGERDRLYYKITETRGMRLPKQQYTTIRNRVNWGMPYRHGNLTLVGRDEEYGGDGDDEVERIDIEDDPVQPNPRFEAGTFFGTDPSQPPPSFSQDPASSNPFDFSLLQGSLDSISSSYDTLSTSYLDIQHQLFNQGRMLERLEATQERLGANQERYFGETNTRLDHIEQNYNTFYGYFQDYTAHYPFHPPPPPNP
ncbi:hypothetical protein RND81_14G091700 [Saponaria officinalis]|uniref:Arabidopsis retrotransposon Orf1 C-terminal domain-containing protein n=1 Tax=Saponaria officinalis TaxID=3572 RepID=A0AAW1GN37_SAPOF